MFTVDREKYLALARTQGYQAALTQLHRDTEKWEYQTFEGEQGWDPQMWKAIDASRTLQRELWDAALLATKKPQR